MKRAITWLLLATLILSLAGCGIGSQSLGGGGQAFSANLQMMDALQREYSNARYDLKLPDLCLSGGYAFFYTWDWDAGDGLKRVSVIRYELSTGERTTLYSADYAAAILANLKIAVTETDVWVAATTNQSTNNPGDVWGTSRIVRIPIAGGEQTELGEVPVYVCDIYPLSSDRIMVTGYLADELLPCSEAGSDQYKVIVNSGGELVSGPEIMPLEWYVSSYWRICDFMGANNVNTFYVDSASISGTGHLNLLDENGNIRPLIALDGLSEIAAADAQAVYLISNTAISDDFDNPLFPFSDRVAKYTISSNTIEDLAIPASVDGASLCDVGNCVGDWVYLRYATRPTDEELIAGPLCRYNIKTGELVDTANAVYTDENVTTPSAPVDAAETEEPETAEPETSLIYTAPLERCKERSGFYRNDGKTYHGGVDFDAADGTEVHAVMSGKVVYADRERRGNKTVGLGGTVVLILGDDGYYYYYAHLSEPLLCEKGDVVVSGQVIARSGRSTRTASGEYSPDGAAAHLHLTIAIPKGSDISIPDGSGKNGTGDTEWFGGKQGVAIDPVAFLKEKGVL